MVGLIGALELSPNKTTRAAWPVETGTVGQIARDFSFAERPGDAGDTRHDDHRAAARHQPRTRSTSSSPAPRDRSIRPMPRSSGAAISDGRPVRDRGRRGWRARQGRLQGRDEGALRATRPLSKASRPSARRLPRRRADALDARLADAVPDPRRQAPRAPPSPMSTATGSTISASATPARCSAIRRRPSRAPSAAQARRGLTYMLPSEDAAVVGQLLERATSACRSGRSRRRRPTPTASRCALPAPSPAATKILVFNGCYHGAVDETFVRLDDGSRSTGRGWPASSAT